MSSYITQRRLAAGSEVEVRRSAWLIQIGPVRLARYRAVGRAVAPADASASVGLARAIGAGTVALVAIGAPIYLTQASAVGEGGYVVSQRVPDRPRSITAPSATRAHRRHAPVVAPSPTRMSEAGDALDGDQALAAAWRTGEPQEWASHGSRGMIVPGAIEREDGMTCRSLARLTRHAGLPDTVARSRQCSVDPAGTPPEAAN